MQLFYVPPPVKPNLTLDSQESLHCIKVLRLKKDDTIHITDGCGNMITAVITDPDKRACRVKVTNVEKRPQEREYRIEIAIAPTKKIERFEWFLEKATEIGIDKIVPIVCRNSGRSKIKTDRVQKIVISAMKQSLKTWLPVIEPLTDFDHYVTSAPAKEKFIASGKEPPDKHLARVIRRSGNISILIGPEGDFTEEEIELAVSCGFLPVSLGESRLRTETAGLVACHTVNMATSLTITGQQPPGNVEHR